MEVWMNITDWDHHDHADSGIYYRGDPSTSANYLLWQVQDDGGSTFHAYHPSIAAHRFNMTVPADTFTEGKWIHAAVVRKANVWASIPASCKERWTDREYSADTLSSVMT